MAKQSQPHSSAGDGAGTTTGPAAVLVAVALTGLALQTLSLSPLRDTFWGFHAFAFVPAGVAAAGWAIVALATVWLIRNVSLPGAALRETAGRWCDRPAVAAIVLAAVGMAVFWLFRSQQTLLGDAQPLIRDLPGGKAFHPRQPLTMALQQFLYQKAGGIFDAGGNDPARRAFDAVAAGSVAAGGVFAGVAAALGGVFARHNGHGRGAACLVAGVLLVQGYTLLFYGYVENYTYGALAVAMYALVAVQYLRGRFPLAGVAVVLVVATGLHLSMVALYPSFVYLAARGLAANARRRDAVVGLAALFAALAGLDAALRAMEPGYSLPAGVSRLLGIARGAGADPATAGVGYLFSARHLRDFFNNQYLLGPVAAVVFLPLCAFGIGRRLYRDPPAVFLSIAALTLLAGSWATAELQLGYARDWDLFAPAAVMYTAAAAYLLLALVRDSRPAGRLLSYAVVVSIVSLVPWVWINHDEARALERFKALPLGGGRTALVVGNWYRRNGDHAAAKRWFERSLGENPNNVDANSYVGIYLAETRQYERARPYFERAVALRPDKRVFRTNYANVLLKLGRFDEAVPHLVWLARRYPGDLDYWHRVGRQMAGAPPAVLLEVYAPVVARLEERLEENPADAVAAVDLGLLLSRIGRGEQALVWYERALELAPRSAAALFNAARVLEDLGRIDEARGMYRRFLEYYPDHERAGYARSRLE